MHILCCGFVVHSAFFGCVLCCFSCAFDMALMHVLFVCVVLIHVCVVDVCCVSFSLDVFVLL